MSAFLFLVTKPFITVYHRYAIFLRPISPSSKKIGVASLNKLLLHNSCKQNFYEHLATQDKSLQFGFFFYKKSRRPFRTILFGKSTVQTFVTLDTSTRYANKSETILHTKPVIAFLNRSLGIKRRQSSSTFNIIITHPKQRQHLCFFVQLSNLFGWMSLSFL